jgi:hypothetical protein
VNKTVLFKNSSGVATGKTSQTVLLLLVIFAYVILIRMPQFLSNNLLPDQDECVIGMMANHFLKGQHFPVFFYGQHYGLSTIEVLFVASGIKLFGLTALAIKLPMLLLYLLAITFLFLWVKNNLGLLMAFLITLLFCAEPTWLLWAMKARGGYLSALLIGFYLLYSWQKNTSKKYHYLCNAFLMGLLYHFHSLWFLAFAPLFFYYQKQIGIKKLLYATTVAVATMLFFYILAQKSTALWYMPATQFHLPVDAGTWYKNFMLFLSGHFYFGYAYNLKYGTLVAIKLLFALHLFIIAITLYLLLKKKLISEVLLCFLIVLMLFFLPLCAFKGVFHFRYWLPFSVTFIALTVVVIKEINWPQLKYVFSIVVIVIAFFGYRAGNDIAKMDIYSDYFLKQKNEKEQHLLNLIADLKTADKKYYLCNDIALMWLLNYYGDDKVLTRWRISKDRHNSQVQEINNYYFKNKKIDLLGAKFSFKEWLPDTANLKVKWIGEDYYLIENIDALMLDKHSYRFGD